MTNVYQVQWSIFVLVFWKKICLQSTNEKKNTNLSHTYVTYGKHSGFLFSSLKFFFFLWWQKFCKICLNETCQIKVFFLHLFWHVFLAINVFFIENDAKNSLSNQAKQTNKNSWLSFTLFFCLTIIMWQQRSFQSPSSSFSLSSFLQFFEILFGKKRIHSIGCVIYRGRERERNKFCTF